MPQQRANQDLTPVTALLERILDRLQPEEIWLFGSRGRGDNRPESDWDLLVVVPDASGEADLHPLLGYQLQKGSGVYADVIVCRATEFQEARDVENTLAWAATHEGYVIYDQESAPKNRR